MDSNSQSNSIRKKVVVIGGGTGSYVVLSGLRNYNIDLYAIVSMTDSGGSTGRLRDQLGVLPPGDLRQALVALSDSSEIWRKIFAYRFDNGDLQGHNFGNIFISVLQRITGTLESAIEEASKVLDVEGTVIPVTFTNCNLCAKYEDGSVIEGESLIDDSPTKRPKIQYMYLNPEAEANPKAIDAVIKADFIVITPGDLYTSIIPNFLVSGVVDALSKSKSKKIYVSNLMTKRGQTDGFTASEHVIEIEKYSNCFMDYVLVNNKKPSPEIIDWYLKTDNVSPVYDDFDEKKVTEAKILQKDLLGNATFEQNISDRVKRSLIRHDVQKLGEELVKIIDNSLLF